MSARSPRASRAGIESGAPPVEAPNTATTSWPVRRSNQGAATSNGAVYAPEVMTTTSSAGACSAASDAATNAARETRRRIRELRTAMTAPC